MTSIPSEAIFHNQNQSQIIVLFGILTRALTCRRKPWQKWWVSYSASLTSRAKKMWWVMLSPGWDTFLLHIWFLKSNLSGSKKFWIHMSLIRKLKTYCSSKIFIVAMHKTTLMQQGLSKHGTQIWTGNNSAFRTKLIHALHAIRGSFQGSTDIFKAQKVVFLEMAQTRCPQFCQAVHNHPAGLLQPIPVPKGAW